MARLMRSALANSVRGMSSWGLAPSTPPSLIGAREVVGFGLNGSPMYSDRCDCPMPAIRFRPDTPEIKLLREKEKGDWKKLSLGEKKALYRASFCQTFEELNAPTGEWKHVAGVSLMFCASAIWIYMALKTFVYDQELPVTFSEERQKAQLKRMLDLGIGRIEGISEEYWKKKGN